MKKPKITPGKNIALKIPPHQFEETLRFYKDILNLPFLGEANGSMGFDFDGKHLWLDAVDAQSQAEIWLEVQVDDLKAAEEYFNSSGIIRRDEIEALPEGFSGFWVTTNSGLIHLVSQKEISY